MKDFFKEASARIKSETPTFFKKVGNLGVAIASAGGAIITPEIVGAHMPERLGAIGGYLLTIGAVMKAVSHLASTTPPDGPK